MNKIQPIEHYVSPGLAEEIRSITKSAVNFNEEEFFLRYPNLNVYIQDWTQNSQGLEFISRLESRGFPLKILDIGVGDGHSSIYLGSKSHEVSCVEPSYDLCKIIASVSSRFEVPLKIYQCTAEAINHIPAKFDLCVFNSSLHHCDNPIQALRNCYDILIEGGSVLVLSELFQRFYTSKKSFHRALSKDPVKMGHYGGNEHVWSYTEYKNMLKKAGFLKTKEYIDFRNFHPRLALRELIDRKIQDDYVHSDSNLFLRFIYFLLMKQICRSKFGQLLLFPVLKRLSLVQISFEGIK